MENVQGLHYRTKDGPTMQFWPTHQHHDFFQGPTLNITPQSAHLDARSGYLVEDAANLPNLPLSWDHITRLDEHNRDAVGSRNWSHNLEWDSLRLIGHPASNGNNGNAHTSGQLPWGVREGEFSSPSPPDNFEENGAPSEPTLLEFGLTSSTQTAKEDDGLLDLKLGGNNTRSLGASEASPSVKRSRHSPPENQQARCQVDSCTADLQNAKDYHRRHKVCEFHAKEPKASVGGSMQRFCQQCSRFHLLKEFDDDRRSCRKRLAGHNRRRRKTQPDATATLACLLADPSVLAKIVASSGQQQGKEELETLLQGNPLVQTLWNTKAAEGALPNNLINALSKSQLLSNLLLSNSTLGCTIPAVQAPPPAPPPPPSAEALLAALSSALLASLPQLQQKASVDVGHDGSVPVKESGQPQGLYTNVSGAHPATKQNIHPRYSAEEQSGLLAFSNPVERPPLLPTTPPVYSDKSNDSNGDSMDERFYFDSCQRGPVEGLVQQDRRHWKARHKTYDETTLLRPGRSAHQTVGTTPTRGYMHVLPDMRTSPPGDHFETTGGGSDHSSDSGLDKQEHTGSLWFKIFDKNPSDLPPSLRNQILAWLDHLPTDMEGHIKPGCIILTVFVCMPVYAWEKLCRNIERSVQKLVSLSDGGFWRTGRVLVHVGDASAFIIDGMVYPNVNLKSLQIPTLALVQPFAIVVGETVNLMLRGSNLKTPGTKAICAYEGNCVYKETDLSYNVREKKRDRHDASQHSFGEEPDVQQEQTVTFNVGPFNNIGRSIIEVEGHSLKGNAFPIVIADTSVSEEINLLESKYVESCEKSQGSARTSSSTTKADIIHFLYELGWLLQRGQRKADYLDLKISEFSISRYRWLLRFSVEQSFCAVVGRILDILFSTDESSTEHACSRAQAVLSDANLLHVAVKNKSRVMVEFLVGYSPPGAGLSTEAKREYYFRPDMSICDGFTPLHVAASMHSAADIVDALTDAPEELWATAWTSAKDSFGETPLMYALKSGNHGYVKMVQNKLQKLSKANASEKEAKPPHLALSIIGNEDVKYIMPPPKRPPFAKQIQHCACEIRESQLTQGLPLRIRGLNKGFIYRPFVLSMLAVAAVCVCVGVLMRGSPDVSCMQGPFVWESISFGSI